DPNPEPRSEQYSWPKPDSAEMRPAFALQIELNGEVSEITEAKPNFELRSSDRAVSTTTEPADAFPIWDRSAGPTHSTEVRGSEPMPIEPLPARNPSVIPEAGRRG